MKKKHLITILCMILACIFLIPIPMRLKDGGTVIYQAVLYSIEDIHRLNLEDSQSAYTDALRIKIFGAEIFYREF